MSSLQEWFNLDEPWRIWLVALGMGGQVVFFTRWIIQWIASEQRGMSYVPAAFWWCSVVGATLLLTYFVLDRDPVGIVGQTVGWVIYARNLSLMKRDPREAGP